MQAKSNIAMPMIAAGGNLSQELGDMKHLLATVTVLALLLATGTAHALHLNEESAAYLKAICNGEEEADSDERDAACAELKRRKRGYTPAEICRIKAITASHTGAPPPDCSRMKSRTKSRTK
jgi:hypothetical protein